MMAELVLMRGYPGSGKTTIANKMAQDGAHVRVSRDDLRHMTYGVWHGEPIDECVISRLVEELTTYHLAMDRNVIIDNTNLDPLAVKAFRTIANMYSAKFRIIDVPTPPYECIARDRTRHARGERHVGEEVIRKMAEQYPIESWPNA